MAGASGHCKTRLSLLSISHDKINTNYDLGLFTNISEQQLFLCLWYVFWRFVTCFMQTALALNLRLQKGQTSLFQALVGSGYLASQTIQERLVTPHVLSNSRSDGTYLLDRDGCDCKLGCIFSRTATEKKANRLSTKLIQQNGTLPRYQP